MSEPVVSSLLDTDLYKFTMMQVAERRYRDVPVEYRLNCRTEGADLLACRDALVREIENLGELRLSSEDLTYLESLGFFAAKFLDRLVDFRLDPSCVVVGEDGGLLKLEVRGSWPATILFEVPLLAILSELYSRVFRATSSFAEGRRRLASKAELIEACGELPGFELVEFGTRRRYSKGWQVEVVDQLRSRLGPAFGGTSNLLLAREFDLRPVGTMAHEYLQAFQALSSRLRDFQKEALEVWLDEYGGQLGIALTDSVGVDAFLRDFGPELTQSYSGLRHDSGDPFAWVDKALGHYESLQIDSRQKILVFSDGLTVSRALDLYRYVDGRARTVFGIGTNLTNDLGQRPLEMVIKMVRCAGRPVAKVPDSRGKVVCEEPAFLHRLTELFDLEPASA